MQAVLGLVPDGGVGAVEDLLRYLLAVVGGQAVEDDRVAGGEPDELVVDSVAREVAQPTLTLLVLAHARPDVRVENVRPGDSLARVVEEIDGGAALGGIRKRDLECVLRRLVSLRRRGPEAHAELRRGDHQRGAHVVAVPEVDERYTR